MKKIFLLSAFIALPVPALAAQMDFSDFSSMTNVMTAFLTDVGATINSVFMNSELAAFVNRLWTFFSIILISWFVINFIWSKAGMPELFSLILTIGITKVLIEGYDSITTALWGWSVGFAEGIQVAAVGNDELFFLPSYIFNICKSLTFADFNLFTAGFQIIWGTFLALTCIVILGVVAMLTASWAIWGYALAKMIGWMFVPMLMFDRLSWLFDGWLRFFFSMLIYNVIARVNLVLAAFVLKNWLQAGAISPTGQTPIQVAFSGYLDIIGLLAFLLIAIMGLLSTGRFASAIAGGAGGMGGGSVLRTAVAFAVKGIK